MFTVTLSKSKDTYPSYDFNINRTLSYFKRIWCMLKISDECFFEWIKVYKRKEVLYIENLFHMEVFSIYVLFIQWT